jgi:hypothetical protein
LLPWKSNKYYVFWVCVCSLIYPACKAIRHIILILWHVRPYHIFPHYPRKETMFGKTLLNIKCDFLFSLQLLSKTFLILRRIKGDIIIKTYVKLRYSYQMLRKLKFLYKFSKNTQISNLMKICTVWAEMYEYYADGTPIDRRTDRQTGRS